MKKWEELSDNIRNRETYEYYQLLTKKQGAFLVKRVIDVVLALILSIIIFPVILILGVIIVSDSKGGVFFKQKRITRYGREFYILKLRTMVSNAQELGTQVTSQNDPRITRIGGKLRKYRLDELPQIFNILKGDMSFVGTRPETPKYVQAYTNEMKATLLMRAGVTSSASILFKDEEELLHGVDDIDKEYIEKVLPEKMKYNLEYIKNFSVRNDLKIMIQTLRKVLK